MPLRISENLEEEKAEMSCAILDSRKKKAFVEDYHRI